MLADLTDRKEMDSARAYLAAIVESSDDAIISKSLDGVVTGWNRGAQVIFGYRAEEIIGRPIAVLFPPDRLHEEDRILAQLQRGERVENFETVRRRKDGREIRVSVTISPVRDETGRVIGASKIARDVTEEKCTEAALRDLNENLELRVAQRTRELGEANARLRAEVVERERAEAVLRQAQKIEAVGQLASGIAHDFNNLLTPILGNSELLDMRLADERLRKLVQTAARSALRGAKLTAQMLAFSRRQHLAPRAIDLNALIAGIEDMLSRTLGGTVAITTSLAPDLWSALVDPHQLETVILNLVINARDAMPLGGSVLIETRNIDAIELDESINLTPGDYVCLSVADTGDGMSDDVLQRACEPFFTTKAPGRGSGLGLSQVYGVARQSGGTLQIKSTIGEGTVIEVYLPRGVERPEQPSEWRDGEQPGAIARGARVLVVDDQEDVREAAAAQLEALGYRVVQAANADIALGVLGNCDSVDLLMVDYAMPGTSGIDLASAARAKCPNLPVLIVTGYADTAFINGRIPRARLMKKPYRMAELAAAIESLLRYNRQSMPADIVVSPPV